MLHTIFPILILLLTSCSFVKRPIIKYKEKPPKIIIKEIIKIQKSKLSNNSNLDEIHDFELDYQKNHFNFWIKYFSQKEKARFLRFIKNGKEYHHLVTKILQSHGLPEDLFFVALIESGYNTYIKSHASAVGPWQFIKGTAKRYGLRVDHYIDERVHIIKSTHAASRYFKDLYNIFGSWELALCAYNAGEYRIINAIRKGNTRGYKQLIKLKLIPKETIFYIPKIAAAKKLYYNMKKFGLNIAKVKPKNFKNTRKFTLSRSFNLHTLSKKKRLSLNTLKNLNPDIKQNWIKVYKRKKQVIYIPTSSKISFKHYKRPPKKKSKRSRPIRRYKIKRGDSLTYIAKKFHTTISKIKKLNKMKKSSIYIGKKILIPSKKNKRNSFFYTVKKGDNLIKISHKIGISIKQIKKYNNLKSNMIRRGQHLRYLSHNIR